MMPASAERRSVSRVSTASGSKKKACSGKGVQVSKPCNICGKVISRTTDLRRHLKIHDPSKKLPCSWPGCKYRTLQNSNLETHYRRHTKDKSYICFDDPLKCDFRTCDPSTLIRHRTSKHNYVSSRASGKVDNSSPSPALPFPSESSTLKKFPFGEISSSLSFKFMPPQPPVFQCSQPTWNSIPDPQMNRSLAHASGWSRFKVGLADLLPGNPTPSHPQAQAVYQHFQVNYTAEFQYSESQPMEIFPHFNGTNCYMPAPTQVPTYLQFPVYNHLAGQSLGQSLDQSHWQSQPYQFYRLSHIPSHELSYETYETDQHRDFGSL